MTSIYPLKRNQLGHIGYAMIINNYAFKPEPRRGSDVDVRTVTASLEKLGFRVTPYIDLSAEKMKETMQWYGTKGQFSTYSCFICVIMSHGDAQSKIFGVDEKTVNLINDLVAPIRDCPGLTNKPKLFFVNACRGGATARLVDEPDNLPRMSAMNLEGNDAVIRKQIPSEADILIHNATVENNVAWRNAENGSHFIQSLCYVLNNRAMEDELAHLLRQVNHKVATEYNMQMPEITDRLRFHFYFNLDRSRTTAQTL
jgi:hypothetical protein